MARALSASFRVAPTSWLGSRLDSGTRDVCSVRTVLAFECKPNKGELPRVDLQEALDPESIIIGRLPDAGMALRGDRIEEIRAAEFKEERMPSVDVCVAGADALLLVECKYRAVPETQIVKSVESFRFNVARKFEASLSFLVQQGATDFAEDRVVLFNAESKDKVVSMFKRLQLQDDAEELKAYCLMDTKDFWKRYQQEICTDRQEGERE